MIKLPENENEWLQKESDFRDTFPHCLGAIDGIHDFLRYKHDSIRFMRDESEYFKYKYSFSIVLMALVDCNFCFMFCDVGNWRCRDCVLFEKLQTNSLYLP